MKRWLVALLLLVPMALPVLRAEDKPAKLPLAFEDNFHGGARRWKPTDPAAWRVVEAKGGTVYNQFKASKYKPPHRSPLNYSLIQGVTVGDFVFEAKAQSTVEDYGHRDLCVFFGYQGPDKFYYAHLAKKTDDHANQIFVVNGAPRTKITTKTTPGTTWTDGWHHIKVVRTVSDGRIAVYFDDMKTPVMTATDKTFLYGQVGVGSFDDAGNWTDIKLFGKKTN